MKATGIIWVGPVYDRGGYGNVSRNYLRGLVLKSLPVRVVSVGPRHDKELGPETIAWLEKLEGTDAGAHPVLILNLNPETFTEVHTYGAIKTVGISIFETDRIPAHWVTLCRNVDEVWVPGEFNLETYASSGVPKSKLWAIPYAMNMAEFNPSRLVKTKPANDPFTMLYIFSFGWRKGFDLMMAAFMNEFKKGEAKLIMRAYTEGYQGVTRENLRSVLYDSVKDKVDLSRSDLPEIEIIDVSLSPEELLKLYGRCDMYISTDRANGWGMPCMEAMALGLPAATINWSGSTGFMTAENSLLIQPTGELEPVDHRLSDALPQLYGGHQWAKVDEPKVRKAMRWATEHPTELAKIATAGQQDIATKFNPEAIADRIIEHIESYTEIKPTAKLAGKLGLSRRVMTVSAKTLAKRRVKRVLKMVGLRKKP